MPVPAIMHTTLKMGGMEAREIRSRQLQPPSLRASVSAASAGPGSATSSNWSREFVRNNRPRASPSPSREGSASTERERAPRVFGAVADEDHTSVIPSWLSRRSSDSLAPPRMATKRREDGGGVGRAGCANRGGVEVVSRRGNDALGSHHKDAESPPETHKCAFGLHTDPRTHSLTHSHTRGLSCSLPLPLSLSLSLSVVRSSFRPTQPSTGPCLSPPLEASISSIVRWYASRTPTGRKTMKPCFSA